MTATTDTPDPIDAATLVDWLPELARSVVVLDFDGTLSELVDDPAAAVPVAGAVEALKAMVATTRVLFVSGRPVDDLRSRLPSGLDLTFAGSHGSELAHRDEPVQRQLDTDELVTRRDKAMELVDEIVADVPGWTIEPKPTGVAVHHRRASEPQRHLPAVTDALEHMAGTVMEVVHGHDVVELRPTGVHKGIVVERLLDGDDRTPIAFGDDMTDEDTFAVVNRLGGVSVLVALDPRPSHARWCLPHPAAVVDALSGWAMGAHSRTPRPS